MATTDTTLNISDAQDTIPAFDLGTALGYQPYASSANQTQSYVDQAYEQQRQAALSGLQGVYNNQAQNISNQQVTLNQEYQQNRGAQDAQYQQSALRLKEIMAARGLGSGQQVSQNARLLASNQGAQSDINLQRQSALNDLQNQLMQYQNTALYGGQEQMAGIESDRLQQLLQLYLAGKLNNTVATSSGSSGGYTAPSASPYSPSGPSGSSGGNDEIVIDDVMNTPITKPAATISGFNNVEDEALSLYQSGQFSEDEAIDYVNNYRMDAGLPLLQKKVTPTTGGGGMNKRMFK